MLYILSIDGDSFYSHTPIMDCWPSGYAAPCNWSSSMLLITARPAQPYSNDGDVGPWTSAPPRVWTPHAGWQPGASPVRKKSVNRSCLPRIALPESFGTAKATPVGKYHIGVSD